MSFEHMQERGVFLPEEQWGEMDLSTSGHPVLVLLSFAIAVGSCVLMVWGGGGPVTWLGGTLFVIFLVGYAWLEARAIEDQNETVRRLGKRPSSESPE